MSTPGQTKPHDNLNKSARVPPPLPPIYKKPRSFSLTPDQNELLG